MQEYLDLLQKIIDKGQWKENRTGIRCLTIPHHHFEFDMESGKFPLCTTRKLPIRSTAVELEGFLRGITDKKWYQDRKCKYWDYWANPIVTQQEYEYRLKSSLCLEETPETYNEVQESETDLGPIYGYQWRSFGKQYGEVTSEDWIEGGHDCLGEYQQVYKNVNGLGYFNEYPKSGDQIATILRSLKNNPNDRRMVCSAWNPNQLHTMALPPCHVLHHVTVLNDTLNLCWFQRSVDTVCGLPQNIASYAILLLLYAKYAGLKPGKLSGFLSDTHIYENHLDGVKEQLYRETRELPTLDICCIRPFEFDDKDNLIINWTHKDIALFDYNPHSPIKFEVAV